MTDPNITYKTGFAELVVKLGRTPTANECLGLHDAYKRAFEGERNDRGSEPANNRGNGNDNGGSSDSGARRTTRSGGPVDQSREFGRDNLAAENSGAVISAAGPSAAGFSREPAPQARSIDAREGWQPVEGVPGVSYRDETVTWEPLSGPGAPEIIPEAVSEPEPPAGIICASEPVLVVASAPCRACGREFERVARRGRPPVKCEECR